MPHCDLELYENILRANWTKERLRRLLLIGNHLGRYTESTPLRILEMSYPCVFRLASVATVEHLPEHSVHPNSFSTTAVQFIKSESLESREDNFWLLPDEIREQHEDGEAK